MTSEQDNVVTFQIPPKTISIQHRKHRITVKYDTETGRWTWVAHYQPPMLHFDGSSATEKKAIEAAKRRLDSLLDAG